MSTRDDDLGQTLLDVGRHGFLLRRHPRQPDQLQIRPVPRLAASNMPPPELRERLERHTGAILVLLAEGLAPRTADDLALLDARILAWDTAGLPADYLRPGGHAWAVIAGELLGAGRNLEHCLHSCKPCGRLDR